MRQLKFHERKLLKKVNFLQWKNEHNHREVEVIRRYPVSYTHLTLPTIYSV